VTPLVMLLACRPGVSVGRLGIADIGKVGNESWKRAVCIQFLDTLAQCYAVHLGYRIITENEADARQVPNAHERRRRVMRAVVAAGAG